jgi:Zn-dependent membrane protease YugP
MWLFYAIAGVTWLFSFLVKRKLTSAYRKWGKVRNSVGGTGAQVAHTVLGANDLQQVQLQPAPGELSDHYDPRTKVIRLSEPVYGVESVAAMAIAAHESGHAIQDKVHYKPFRVRSSLVPLASLGARFGLPAAVMGLMMGAPLYVQIGVLTYLGALVFQFATLPVEYNASKRAQRQLDDLGLVDEKDKQGVKEMLSAAALTYVAGVASSAGYLIFLVLVGGKWLFRRPPVAPPV